MADLSTVETAIVDLIASIIFAAPYNSGDYQTSVALEAFPPPTSANPSPSLIPITTKLYRGWPEEANMDADLALGRAHVSVFPEQGVTQNTTAYFPLDSAVTTIPAPSLAWTVAGNTATLSGTIITPQNIAIVVDGLGISYGVQPGDTLSTAAAALAALIAPTRTATTTGPTITIPGSHSLVARVGVVGTTQMIVSSQKQGFRVSIWTATPAARDTLSSLIGAGISGLLDTNSNPTEWIDLSDGTGAQIVYRTTYVDDRPEKARLWRRDICYSVTYYTTISITAPTVTVATESEQLSTVELTSLITTLQPPKITRSF